MRCRYCFQTIPDRSARCPHCGSRLPKQQIEAAPESDKQEEPEADGGPGPLSAQQTAALVGGVLLVVALLFAGLVALLRPSLLPQPVVDRLSFLATSTPLPTPQATRAPITPSPTPRAMEAYCSDRGDFCIRFPESWLVIDQGRPPWQREVEAFGETYDWAPSVFVTRTIPTAPRIRAVPPSLIDLEQGRITRFTAGETGYLEDALPFDDVERLARQEPQTLAPPEDIIVPATFTVGRIEREAAGNQEGAMVEYAADVRVMDVQFPVRGRLHFYPRDDRLFVVSYLADEGTFTSQRSRFDAIVQSFEVDN